MRGATRCNSSFAADSWPSPTGPTAVTDRIEMTATVTGRYFKEGKEAVPNPLSQDRALAKAVWERSAMLTRANVQPH